MWLTRALFITCAASTMVQARSPIVPSGTPIDEAYRRQFTTCDTTDRFGAVQFPIRNAKKKVIWYGCKSDPSRLIRLERVAARGAAPEAIIWSSKIARDDDGSPKACNSPGTTDQCPTTLMLKPTAAHPCPAVLKGKRPDCLPVDASIIPYIVIPAAAPKGIDGARFRSLTGLTKGDVGVVIANDKVVPVIVADTGPAYKIGEGSAALLSRLSSDGHARPISGGVVFIVFPKSDLGRWPNPETLAEDVRRKATGLYNRLVGVR